VIVGLVTVATAVVVIVKLTDVWPADIVTDDGTVAAALLELRLITSPFDPATPVSVIVPLTDVPPMTDVGLIARL